MRANFSSIFTDYFLERPNRCIHLDTILSDCNAKESTFRSWKSRSPMLIQKPEVNHFYYSPNGEDVSFGTSDDLLDFIDEKHGTIDCKEICKVLNLTEIQLRGRLNYLRQKSIIKYKRIGLKQKEYWRLDL